MPTKYSIIWRDSANGEEVEDGWHVLFQSNDRMRPWVTTRRSDAEGVAQNHRLRGVEVHVVDRATVHYRIDNDQLILTSTPRILLKETGTMQDTAEAQRERAIAQLQATVADARSTLEHAEHQLKELSKPPVPPEPAYDHISFEKRMGGRVYKYLAIYANGRWYTTGSTAPWFTWPKLVEFIRDRNEIADPGYRTLEFVDFVQL